MVSTVRGKTCMTHKVMSEALGIPSRMFELHVHTVTPRAYVQRERQQHVLALCAVDN